LETTDGDFVVRIPRGRQGFYTAYLPPTIRRARWFDQRWALEQAGSLGIPAPRLVISHRRRPRFVVLTKLAGVPISDYETWSACPYDEAEFGAILARLHATIVSGYGPIDDAGRAYFPTWPAFLQAVAARVLNICQSRASIGEELAAHLWHGWYPRLAGIPAERPRLLHLESLGFANLLYDPTSRRITGLLDYEDCCGGDPLFELTWMSYYYGDHANPRAAFDYRRFIEGYGPWPDDAERAALYTALMYLEKLAWIDPGGARAADHRRGLEEMSRGW
jgi:aminoglycoside phosphotransferase (APT) family kinase protein